MATLERIPLQRSVAVVREDSIAVRPSRGQLLGPMVELGIALVSVALIVTMLDVLPLLLLMVLLLLALILGPIGVLGVVYSAIGSSFVMERRKNSARWQQGFLGLGIGTVELVPFQRIKRIDVDTDFDDELRSGELNDIVHCAVVLVKDNDRRLTIGTVAAARPLADLGVERANGLAAHVAAMAGVEAVPAILPEPDTIEEATPQPVRPRRKRRTRRVSPPHHGA